VEGLVRDESQNLSSCHSMADLQLHCLAVHMTPVEVRALLCPHAWMLLPVYRDAAGGVSHSPTEQSVEFESRLEVPQMVQQLLLCQSRCVSGHWLLVIAVLDVSSQP
jgi:hypothetical protein